MNATPPEPAITSVANARSTEVYDATTGLFMPGPNMGSGRFFHTGTPLVDGSILLVGGIADPMGLVSKAADLFILDATPQGGTMQPMPPDMAVPLRPIQAEAADDGRGAHHGAAWAPGEWG